LDFAVIAADGAAAVLMVMGIVPRSSLPIDANSKAGVEKGTLDCRNSKVVIIHAHKGKISITLKNL